MLGRGGFFSFSDLTDSSCSVLLRGFLVSFSPVRSLLTADIVATVLILLNASCNVTCALLPLLCS